MITELKNVLLDDFWIMPQTPKYTESGIPYITSKNIKGGKINFENVNYISIDDYKKISKNRPILKNDILISMIGTLGETAIVDDSYGEFYGQNMFLVRLDNSKIDYRFFINFFKSTHVKNHLARKQNKSTQSYLKANHIESLMIPVFTIKEQKEIANQLDKVHDLIKLKIQQIEKLDELIKSQFVEMFGDPNFNNKNWKINKWNEVLTIKNGKNQKKVEQEDGIYPIYGSGGIMSYANDYICNEDSVIIGRKGNINNPILVRTKFWNVDTAFGLEPCKEKIIVEYLYYFCYFYNFEKHNKAVTIPSLTKTDLLNIDIPIPPIELQNKFAEFVKQIDKQKIEIENSLKEMQELYESLMDKYFG